MVFACLLDLIDDFPGVVLLDEFVGQDGIEHDARGDVARARRSLATRVLRLERLLDFEPALLEPYVSEHDVAVLEIVSELSALQVLDCLLDLLVVLLFECLADHSVVRQALVDEVLVLVGLGLELETVELVFDVA